MMTGTDTLMSRGTRTQNRILEKAVQIASIEGLDSMSLATLAKATDMSKSGLFAHFRSKEALQLAILEEAERIFFDALAPVPGKGGDRLENFVMAYVDYSAQGPFAGGCFFASTAHEFDGRPGPVRERVLRFFDRFDETVKTVLVEQKSKKTIRDDVDEEDFVFALSGIGLQTNLSAQMGKGELARVRARKAARTLLESVRRPV